MSGRIDAHQHFWRYSPEEYGWIDERMAVLRRDFLPTDLEPELREAGLAGCVAVQARETVAETQWLCELAEQHAFIKGVVGWVPLTDTAWPATLERLSSLRRLRGVREICQGKPPGFMLRPDFLRGIGELARHGLAYDILIFESQLPEAIQLVDSFPAQTFVLDHIAKPTIRARSFDAWATDLAELARREQVYCKLSGLVTEAGADWAAEDLRPYLEHVLRVFGPGRIMFGSDWPVCLLAASYQGWHAAVRDFVSRLSASEQDEIFGGTCLRAYACA